MIAASLIELWKALVERIATTATLEDPSKKKAAEGNCEEHVQANADFQLLFNTLYSIARGETIDFTQQEIGGQPFTIPSAKALATPTWLVSLLVLLLQGTMEALPSHLIRKNSSIKVPPFLMKKKGLGATVSPALALLQLHIASVASDASWASEFAESLRILADKSAFFDNLTAIARLLLEFPQEIATALFVDTAKCAVELAPSVLQKTLPADSLSGIKDLLLSFHHFRAVFEANQTIPLSDLLALSKRLVVSFQLPPEVLRRFIDVQFAVFSLYLLSDLA